MDIVIQDKRVTLTSPKLNSQHRKRGGFLAFLRLIKRLVCRSTVGWIGLFEPFPEVFVVGECPKVGQVRFDGLDIGRGELRAECPAIVGGGSPQLVDSLISWLLISSYAPGYSSGYSRLSWCTRIWSTIDRPFSRAVVSAER